MALKLTRQLILHPLPDIPLQPQQSRLTCHAKPLCSTPLRPLVLAQRVWARPVVDDITSCAEGIVSGSVDELKCTPRALQVRPEPHAAVDLPSLQLLASSLTLLRPCEHLCIATPSSTENDVLDNIFHSSKHLPEFRISAKPSMQAIAAASAASGLYLGTSNGQLRWCHGHRAGSLSSTAVAANRNRSIAVNELWGARGVKFF
eukprot:CAMPEP_0181314804 /NCGR_PEP_ID=MMETSP1101-20121128/15018_1 /TAXON_ID=46948 /ORGANISM="Rhodomonas abbreviata, Strain Caron Lab Isolate" /LENGTH=202 /DNA_ID=CAMNT_0023421931 /DNA_START=103 /DNA_END=709 /DNA_ORIENTATION=+